MTNNSINLSQSGIASNTGIGTFVGRTLTAGSSKILLTNGSGILGTPSIDIVEANISLANLGGTLTVAQGGTGVTSNTAFAPLCGGTTSTNPIQSTADAGTIGYVLKSNGAGALPTYQRPPAWEFISTATAANSTSITFIGLTSSYFMYRVVADNIVPITDGTSLLMRTSTNNGSSYDAGVSDYAFVYNRVGLSTGAGISSTGDNLNSSIVLMQDMGTAANERGNFILNIINPSNTTFTFIIGNGVQTNSSAAFGILYDLSGIRLSAADVDAIQFLMLGGNISTGTFKLYGLKAS